MEEYKDYYKIMGVDAKASQDEIKRAYRKLARKYHPDVSKEADAEAKFKDLGEAYTVLSDKQKRAQYDQYGQYWKEQQHRQTQQPGGHQRQYQSFHEGDFSGFEEFINNIFRERQQQNRHQSFYAQGEDVHAKLTISLEDSFHGAEKTLQLQTPSINQEGFMDSQQRAIKVKIPAGITNNQQIRLKGQGGQGRGASAGDLYIEIHIAPHSLFHLQKKDIHLEVPISPWEAALGATIQIPTLAGQVNLKIPKLTQAGKQMRLKGRGLPGNPPGDQFVVFKIVIPNEDNEALTKLYQQMANTTNFDPREKLGVSYGRK